MKKSKIANHLFKNEPDFYHFDNDRIWGDLEYKRKEFKEYNRYLESFEKDKREKEYQEYINERRSCIW